MTATPRAAARSHGAARSGDVEARSRGAAAQSRDAATRSRDAAGSAGGPRADFSFLRYAQCWEDADVLLEALAIGPGHVCVSIASAGDNSLSMLSRGPKEVIAVDLNPAQLAAVALRVAAYRNLEHGELLTLIGSRPADGGGERAALYARCRRDLDDEARAFWDAHPEAIAGGVGAAGKFENYFRLFRRWILPFVHGRRAIAELLVAKPETERARFYRERWDSYRWRVLFRVFFSRTVMGRLGRDPAFFDYVDGSVADRILGRVRHALTVLEPAENPYAQWILTGTHGTALPHALRAENFGAIRDRLDRFSWHRMSLDELLDARPELRFDRANLSDIFEYLSPDESGALLAKLAARGRPGARLAYWNMLAPRSRPESLADRLVPLEELANRLHLADKAFFYSRFVVEEVLSRTDAGADDAGSRPDAGADDVAGPRPGAADDAAARSRPDAADDGDPDSGGGR